MNNFITRAITGVLFVAAIAISFTNFLAMIFLFSLVTALTMREFCNLVNDYVEHAQVNTFICTIAGTYFFLAIAGYVSGITYTPAVFIPYLITIIYLLVSELYTKAENPVMNWAYTMFSQMYVALPFSLISVLALQGQTIGNSAGMIEFTTTPLAVFIFLWLNDTGAYCVGSLIGKHKLFPRVSPAKSWEGSIGGGIFVLLVATLIWYISRKTDLLEILDLNIISLSLPQWLSMGAVVAVFGTWGDLIESLFKRTLGIKDSGNILPGHGGMLDRFDSSLLAFPAVVVYLYTIQILS